MNKRLSAFGLWCVSCGMWIEAFAEQDNDWFLFPYAISFFCAALLYDSLKEPRP